ncbi:hypothetical protein AGMMS50256_33500 [Betaproteobacteria bacterium]|nr:hypothetical protein AGMMS50256_33500 [Betaproteobacteria bacterium]
MKTTLNLNDVLLTQAKAHAVQQHISLTRLIEEGLQLRLRTPRRSSSPLVRLPVHHGKGGLTLGLDGLSNKALLAAAEEE